MEQHVEQLQQHEEEKHNAEQAQEQRLTVKRTTRQPVKRPSAETKGKQGVQSVNFKASKEKRLSQTTLQAVKAQVNNEEEKKETKRPAQQTEFVDAVSAPRKKRILTRNERSEYLSELLIPKIDENARVISKFKDLIKDMSPFKFSWNDLETDKTKLLGSGASSDVFEGHLSVPDRFVVNHKVKVGVKKYKREFLEQDEDYKCAFQEIKLSGKFAHCENVVKTLGYAIDADTGLPCLLTELCSEGTLAQIIEKRGEDPNLQPNEPLSKELIRENIKIAKDITKGVNELHTRGVIHMDVKPSNIFRTQENKYKIADFGHLTLQNDQSVRGYGTEQYCSPEVWELYHLKENFEENPGLIFSEKSDVWSLGCVLWELFHPCYSLWDGLDEERISKRKLPGINPLLPIQIQNLLKRCLEYSHRRRISSNEILTVLDRIERELLLN